jgi:hypothetical protein
MAEWCHQALSDHSEDTTAFENPAYISRFKRADERTRTADLISLRVCGRTFLGVAGVCKSRIGNGFSVPSIALYRLGSN